MTMTSTIEPGVRTRAFADKAVQAALEADWARATDLNTRILAANAEDLEARNRLGRALLETGKLDEAKAAYGEVLKAEPNNPIALRNVARLTTLLEYKTKINTTKSKTQPRLFIEDMGKTGILRLINPAPPQVVAKYSPGAEAELRERDGLIAVHARDGELLGFLEPKVGRRLLDLIKTGNEYVVAVVSNDQQNPRVAIRETLQSPENAQRISFPGHHRPAETKERAYIKGNFFRFGGEEEDDADESDESEPVLTAQSDDDADPAALDEPLAVEADDDDDEDEADE
ncbi:MAG TPA: tetratricopeptide repeat protein [Candidatus Limnocylindria bacterium]|nr:tetratricopeptide repeat protein [Candidatus Limnocylindria bacterium]